MSDIGTLLREIAMNISDSLIDKYSKNEVEAETGAFLAGMSTLCSYVMADIEDGNNTSVVEILTALIDRVQGGK